MALVVGVKRSLLINSLHQSEERLPMKMRDLVELVSKKPVIKGTQHLLVEVMVSDEQGEDVEVR